MGAGLEQNKVWNAMTEDAPNLVFLEVAQSTARFSESEKQQTTQKENGEKVNTPMEIIP